LQQSLQQLDTRLPRPFAQLKGQLRWPVQGRLLQRFGSPGPGDVRRRGVDLEGQPEAPVRAIAHGRVVFADWLRGYGLLLIVDHGDDWLSLYGRNSALFRQVGEWVGPGEVLGRTSEDGRLYLELRHRAKPVDPEPWFSGSPLSRAGASGGPVLCRDGLSAPAASCARRPGGCPV